MDSKILRQHDADLGSPSEGGDGKKSVLKMVKAKAKKIKDTLKTHGHGHDRDDHDINSHDQSHDEEEYDDVDEEMVEDPDVHGATTRYDTSPFGNGVVGEKPVVNLERPTVVAEDRYDSKYTDPPKRPFEQLKEENSGKPGDNLGRETPMGVTEHVPENRDVSFSSRSYGGGGDTAQPKINSETPTSMEDPHAPKDRPELSNYQTKVTNPNGDGGEEAGITPIIRSFDKMNVCDEPESKSKAKGEPELYAGSHHEFSPGPVPRHTTINPDDPGSILKTLDPNKPEDTVTGQPENQSGYTKKISYATSAIADKAIAAKNVVASKLGYGSNEDSAAAPLPKSTQGREEIKKSGSTAEYGQKIVDTLTEKLAPIYEKVSNAGTSVASKVHGTGTEVLKHERGDKEEENRVSVKEYWAEKLRPSDEDKALSEVISDALPKQKLETEEKRTVGKVTESEEVRKRLGSDEDSNREMTESETRVAANVSSAGKAGFESLKGAVTSWFSPGGQKQTSAPGTTHGGERTSSSTGEEAAHGENGVGEQRLQE